MSDIVINYRKLYEDLNKARKARNISWNKLATRAGITTSGLHTFVRQFEEEGSPRKEMSLEGFAKLMAWLRKTDISEYTAEADDLV